MHNAVMHVSCQKWHEVAHENIRNGSAVGVGSGGDQLMMLTVSKDFGASPKSRADRTRDIEFKCGETPPKSQY
jgi:hypothetical protein